MCHRKLLLAGIAGTSIGVASGIAALMQPAQAQAPLCPASRWRLAN